MDSQRNQSGHNRHVEAIDLTLSSPEPEAQPQYRADNYVHRLSATAFRKEPRLSHRPMQDISSPSQRQGSAIKPRQHPRRIDPQHIRQMIDSSSHRALRDVVLQLCQQSEALSGAIMRGLQPHSSWAQALVRRQQIDARMQTQHTVKTESRVSDYDLARMRKRPGRSSALQHLDKRSPAAHQSRDSLRVPTAGRKDPLLKHEHRTSPTDSDDSTNIVDFPTTKRDRLVELLRDPVDSSSSNNRSHADRDEIDERRTLPQSSTKVSTAEMKPKLCLRCHEFFSVGDVTCSSHPGRELSTQPGDIPQYSCCNKFAGEPGCKVGEHVGDTAETPSSSKRPSPSPHEGPSSSKRSRVL